MFNNKDNEADFCESYKSQILGNNESKKRESFFSTFIKLLTILILLVIIMGVSFYGYNYFMNHKKSNNSTLPPISMQISDDDLVVEMEELEIEPEEIKLEKEDVVKHEFFVKEEVTIEKEVIIKEEIIEKEEEFIEKEEEFIEKEVEKVSLPLVITAEVEESEMDKMANAIKIAIAKSELQEENETKIEKILENILPIEDANVEEEVESLEVPTSAPEAKYLEELADLSKEIDKERNQ